MLFWTFAALLTVVALIVVLWPFFRAARPSDSHLDLEMALYQGQVAAIEREQAEGRISVSDAEATRIEVKRRMLTASRRRSRRVGHGGRWIGGILDRPRSAKVVVLVIEVLVPVSALVIYLAGGMPNLPDQPYASRGAERAAAGMPSQEELSLVRKLAAQMARHPADPKGWALLGASYVRQERYDDAVDAYTNAVKRSPDDAEYESALGEALVLQAGGEVTERARARFKEALQKDKGEPRALYFLALAKAQAGDVAGAAADWTALLKNASPDAPWRSRVEAQLNQARASLPDNQTVDADASRPTTGTTNANAIADLPPEQRTQMVHKMVDRLAQRLRSNPDDLDGWLRLARSYSVLGEPKKARAALDEAARHFHGNNESMARINRARSAITDGESGGTFNSGKASKP